MPNPTFVPVTGIIQNISPMNNDCCSSMISIRTNDGITNFVLSPSTYVIQETLLRPGMRITAFYDPSLPMPLIFPPQYQAVFITRNNTNDNVFAGYFNDDLVSEDNALKLNIARSTEILTSNGQRYNCSLTGKLLIVYYRNTTRSVPPQTTPRRIVVVC